MMENTKDSLRFVTCASNLKVLGERLLTSPCLRNQGHSLAAYFNAPSAAYGFNAAMAAARDELPHSPSESSWLVWVHQDVYLPQGWDTDFAAALNIALRLFPKLAVAGVYGVCEAGADARRAGHILDRGALLRETELLPCLVNSLDELLFAVRIDVGLQLDPVLGFDFYATDLVLQAQKQGWQCAVVDGYCEHWSDTPSSGDVSPAVAKRILTNGEAFELKWQQRFPVTTPCFDLYQLGDVARSLVAIMGTPARSTQ
jgi:hypothetical protein